MHQHECKISLTWVCNDADLNSSMMHTKRNDTRLRLLPGAKIMLRLHSFDLVRKLTLYERQWKSIEFPLDSNHVLYKEMNKCYLFV